MSIILHPRLGINPRLTFCQRCGGDAQELVMLGSRNYKEICEKCGMVHYGGVERKPGAHYKECGNPGCGGWSFKRVELTDQEKLPSPTLCTKCAAMQQQCDDAVAAGGVYWKCEGCGSEGAMVAESEFAKEARAKHPELDGQPMGVLINPCPVCLQKPNDNDTQELEP